MQVDLEQTVSDDPFFQMLVFTRNLKVVKVFSEFIIVMMID